MSDAFQRSWEVMKFRIPDISERSHRERKKEDWERVNEPYLWSGKDKDRITPFSNVPKPERYANHPSYQGQDFQFTDWDQPRSHGISTDQGVSFINAGRIIADILGVDPNTKEPLPPMTNEEIERAISVMVATGKHEAVHDALSLILPYEGIRRGMGDSISDMRERHKEYLKLQEYGAMTGEHDTRMGALRGMAMHPNFSDDPNSWDAVSTNPHMKRLEELLFSQENRGKDDEELEQAFAILQGKRARENAARRGGSRKGSVNRQ